MLMSTTPITPVIRQVDNPPSHDELNRLLSAAVVSKSFRNMLLTNAELAVRSGYQGETFNLSPGEQSWLYSIRPTSLIDLAANMVAFRQSIKQESMVKLPVEPMPHLVRVN
jgi:hypothetical protein